MLLIYKIVTSTMKHPKKVEIKIIENELKTSLRSYVFEREIKEYI